MILSPAVQRCMALARAEREVSCLSPCQSLHVSGLARALCSRRRQISHSSSALGGLRLAQEGVCDSEARDAATSATATGNASSYLACTVRGSSGIR